MLFDQANTAPLKAWLAKELEPICDADPEVLSDYVLALLKHDASDADLRKLLLDQLSDFLSEQTVPFVDKTFAALTSNSYLPSGAAPGTSRAGGASSSSSAPDAAAESSRKRAAEEEGRRSPPKARRSSPPRNGAPLDAPRAPAAERAANGSGGYDREGEEGRTRERDLRERERDSRSAERARPIGAGPQRDARREGPREGPRELCRDYHNIGFCSRGANCKYLHSSDMIMGGGGGANGFPGGPRMGPMGPMGPMPMGPGFMNGPFPGQGFPMQGSPPGQPGPSMQPYGVRPPMGSPMGPLRADSPGQRPGSQPPVNGAPESLQGEGPSLASRISTAPSSVGQGETPSPPMPMGAPAGFMGAPEQGFGGGQSRIVAPGGGRGRGGRPGHFQSNRRSQTTLVIENVPQEHLDLVKVNEYFKKFGTITNISIDAANSKALVSYSMPAEAKRAHESPDVIFGNRFVKVYFQRLDEPAPDASAAPPPQKPGFVPGQTPNVYHARPPTAPAQASSGPSEERKKQMAAMVELQKQKQELLNRQIGEQKALMEKLDGKKNMDPEERKGIMQALRKLGDEIKANTAAAKETAAAASSVASSKASPAPSGASHVTSNAADGAKSQSWKEQREQKERERLDRELELHAKGSAPGSTTEELKAKLEALKAEAASLGLDASSGAATSGHQPRGRGRGAYVPRGSTRGYTPYNRGRGAASVNRSFRLDNRTTKLTVSALPEGTSKEKAQEHFKQFGEIDSMADSDGGFVVAYKTRANAEQAFRQGATIPDVGAVKLAWAAADPVTPSSAPGTPAEAATKEAGAKVGAGVGAGAGAGANEDAAGTTGSGADGQDDQEEEEGERDSSWKR